MSFKGHHRTHVASFTLFSCLRTCGTNRSNCTGCCEAGEVLLEITGEVVRRPVAKARMQRVSGGVRADICRMMALDADHVLDWTHAGNIGRFINPSARWLPGACQGSCTFSKLHASYIYPACVQGSLAMENVYLCPADNAVVQAKLQGERDRGGRQPPHPSRVPAPAGSRRGAHIRS